MPPTVFVALPVFNRLEETKKFIACIRKQSYPNIQVVICDDASSDGTGEYLRCNAPEVVVLEGTGDLWWAGGINKCIDYVLGHARDEDLVVTTNNDVVFDTDYISQKVARSNEFPGTIIGSVCVYQSAPDIIETSGFIMNYKRCSSKPLLQHGTLRSGIKYKGYTPVTHLPGKGVLVPVNVYKAIGIYDAKGLPHYHADTDFTLRASESGIPVFVDFDSIIYSNVNTDNMNKASDITLSGIVKTFDSKSGVNSWTAYKRMAHNHFRGHEGKYLFVTYCKIVGGLILRYTKSKLSFLLPSRQ